MPAPLPLPRLPHPPPPPDDVLLHWAEPVRDARVLVVGHGALDLICGLIRRGCAAATELQAHGRLAPDPESADVVLAPAIGDVAEGRLAIGWAQRVLALGGRIALRDASGGRLASGLAVTLRGAGLGRVRVHPRPEGPIVTAERPMFGPLHRG